tara:strand:+ start:167 stop:538 length:372 start_codon:yes stop_codon:yes gene_type:complete
MTKSETNNDMNEKMANLRAKKAPAKLSNIHPSVLELSENHPLSYVNIKKWIVTQEGIVKVGKAQERSRGENQKLKDEGMRNRLDAEAYIRSMKKYLSSGDWSSVFYGEHEDKLVKWKVINSSE